MMYQKITIGNKELMFCACASVNVCYFNVFHEDFIKALSSDEGLAASTMMKMAFIMQKFADLNDRKAVNRLTIDDYCDWLDQFTTGDFVEALPKIEAAYMESNTQTVDAKKNNTGQNES